MGAESSNTATFSLELEDESSAPAEEIAGSLENLKKKLLEGTEELRAMQTAMRNLKGSTSVNVAAFRELKAQIDAKKASIAQAQASYINLGGSLKDLSEKAKTVGLKELASVAKAGGGPIAGLVGRASELKGMLGAAGVAGAAVAAGVAIVALTAAIAGAVVAFASFAVAQADAARSEGLMLEGLTKIPSYFGFAAGKASELQDAISSVTLESAIGREKIANYATELYRMGLRGENLSLALKATTTAASAAGEGYANMVKGMAAGAAFSGQSVKKLADTIEARFGRIAKAQALALPVQLQKLHEGFAHLFSGVKIEGFLEGLHSVLSLFNETTYTGKALKAMAEAIFNPLIKVVEYLSPLAKRFFQGIVIGFLLITIQALKVRNALRDAFGGADLLKKIDGTWLALTVGKITAGVLAASIITLAAAFAIMGISIALALAPLAIAIVVIGLVIAGVVYAVVKLATAFADAYAWVKSLDWGQIGSDLIDGLVNGIKSGVGAVVDAVKNLGKSAITALRGAWDSHSPSRLFAKVGITAPQGIVEGVDKGAPAVGRAVSSMVSIPAELGAGDGAPAARGAAGSKVEIHELHYHASANGKASHEADAQDLKGWLEKTLEGVAIRLGAPT